MKTKLKFALLGLAALIFLDSCGKSDSSGSGNPQDSLGKSNGSGESVLQFEKNGIKVYALENSPQFPDAGLTLEFPEPGTELPDGKNRFQFKVENFTLGEATLDAAEKGIANSKDGQHIHFILNNEPYHAHYGNVIEHELKTGHYVMLSFLSRSYHESVKSPRAFVLRQFVVGAPDAYKEADLNAPHLFFSRPKGEYFEGDTRKLLLDFYLVNCDLSPDGYKVKATINGNEFLFTRWLPYIIEGLPYGDVNIRLELLDQAGNTVKSPFNPAERTVKLTEKKPA